MPLLRRKVNTAVKGFANAKKSNKSEPDFGLNGRQVIDFKGILNQQYAEEKLKEEVKKRSKFPNGFIRALASPSGMQRLIKLKKTQIKLKEEKILKLKAERAKKQDLGYINPILKNFVEGDIVTTVSKGGSIRSGKIIEAEHNTLILKINEQNVPLNLSRIVQIKFAENQKQ